MSDSVRTTPDFLTLPGRPPKPRQAGITHVIDKGLSVREAEDLVATSGEYIDIVKLGWGTSYVTGNLRDWDRTARLGEIGVPVLLISGEHDESTPLVNQVLVDGIRGAQWHLMPGCSHFCHVEAPEAYRALVTEFLGKASSR